MAILGKDPLGMITPGFNQKNSEEESKGEEMPVKEVTPPEENSNPGRNGTSLEYLDTMREIKNRGRAPIGNQLQSDAKSFDPNNRFNH